MPFIQRDHQSIHFEDFGGEGPLVLFQHSMATNGSLFAPQIEVLRRHYRCVVWDMRAHGKSPTSRPFTFWDSADDALAILDELDAERAAFIGTSQGGFVAMRVGIKAPERVTAIAVLGTSARGEHEATKAAYTQLSTEMTSSGKVQERAFETFTSICFGDGFDARGWHDAWRSWPAEQSDFATRALVGRDDIVDRLGEIKAPLLVLHGTADGAYPIELAEEIVSKTPRSEKLVRVEGGSHFLSATSTAVVNEALLSFLGRHAGPSA